MPETILAVLTTLPVPAATAARLGLASGLLRLRRAWPRSTTHMLLEYEDGAAQSVPAQWWAERALAEQALGEVEPAAVALVNLAHANGVVALQLNGADRRLPGLAPLMRLPGARLLVHQPGRRAVVRLQEASGLVFAKVVRPARSAALAASGAAAEQIAGDAFATPRLLGVDAQRGVLRWAALPGLALHELPSGPALAAGARAAGRALRALHEATPPITLAHHGPSDEIQVLQHWVALTAAYAPQHGALLAELARARHGCAEGPLRAAHQHPSRFLRQADPGLCRSTDRAARLRYAGIWRTSPRSGQRACPLRAAGHAGADRSA